MNKDKEISDIVFENLVAFACSDGLDKKEEEFLLHFAEENNIERSKAVQIIENKGNFAIPDDSDTKREILNFMIDLAMVDGNFSTEELDLCNKFVQKLGLDASMVVLTTKLLTSLNTIDEQKKIILEKNKDINDSLEAAKRIQSAILPHKKHLDKHLPESFVVYLPKDIVSGDFYWMEPLKTKSESEESDVVFISAVDCTGHGVPGAFMSIVGHNGLTRALREFGIVRPGEMLKMLNRIVGENLNTGDNKDIKNGMDIALCALNKRTRELEYAGALNSLYLVKKSGAKLLINNPVEEKRIHNTETHTLYEIKGDRNSIGANEEEANFMNHEIVLEKGDTFYICSDGYVDQNGGPNDKKFRPQPFRKMLLDIQGLNMNEQEAVILNTIKDWMGDREQRDDIVVIGVKVE